LRIASLGVNKNLVIKSGLGKVQSGDILTVRIIENRNGRIKASIHGKIITVKSSMNLIDGQVLKVKAGWKGRTLILNLVDADSNLKSIINELNIQANSAALNLFRAAGTAGLVLKDDIIKLIKRFLRGRKKLSSEEAGAAVELFKKGLYPENLIQLFCGDGEPDERDEQKKLLFNHLQDGEEQWFIIPFNFSSGSRAIKGSIRLQKRKINKKTEKVVIVVHNDDNKYYFVIDKYTSEKRRMHIFYSGELSADARLGIKTVLTEILGNMGLEIDDNIREKCFQNTDFDGFSLSREVNFGIEEVV
jgi:hypothetical protein